MDKIRNIIRSDSFQSPFYAIATFLWLWIPIRYIDWYGYKYPVIKNGFIILTIANILIPLIVMILSGVLAGYQRKRLSLVLKILIIFCIVIGYIWLNFETLAINSICSETIQPRNYGKYDDFIPEEWLSGLPEEIPEDAQNVQYYYFAEKELDFYIAVSWRYDEEQKFASAIEQLQSTSCTEDSSQIVWELNNKNVVAIADKDELRIYYVACSREEYLPENADEIYWDVRREWPYETGDT